LPPWTALCYPLSGQSTLSQSSWLPVAQSYGSTMLCAARLGSLCGASVAYRLARLGILHRRIEGALLDRVRVFLHRFGPLPLSFAALLPPPFPTSAFVIGAGVTRYPFIAFVLSFGLGRVCRFALLAYLASVFGRRFVTSVWSGHMLALVAIIGGVLACVGLLAWFVFRKSEPHTPPGL
jgi:membrane protein DedA with SNARE-associated domain